MSVNRHRPHVLVLPEDDANSQLAAGFRLEIPLARDMQILPVAGGWNEVLKQFDSEHKKDMTRFPHRFIVLLIDFDRDGGRLSQARLSIPNGMENRVFILGVWSEPEDLKRANLGSSYEPIGRSLARACIEDGLTVWNHKLLEHNANEVERLRRHVRPILFPPARAAQSGENVS